VLVVVFGVFLNTFFIYWHNNAYGKVAFSEVLMILLFLSYFSCTFSDPGFVTNLEIQLY
jgi:hypothetical protein